MYASRVCVKRVRRYHLCVCVSVCVLKSDYIAHTQSKCAFANEMNQNLTLVTRVLSNKNRTLLRISLIQHPTVIVIIEILDSGYYDGLIPHITVIASYEVCVTSDFLFKPQMIE